MTHKLNHYNPANKKERGAVLAISLIMLLLLTIIGVTSIQSTTLQERMAGNARDMNTAFQAAESALRAGETVLTVAILPTFNASGGAANSGLYLATTPPKWESIDWTTDNVGSFSDLTNVASDPQYIIEELPAIAGSDGTLEAGVGGATQYYRVTARGVGGTANTAVILQSIYKR